MTSDSGLPQMDPKIQRAVVMIELGLSPDHPVDERVTKQKKSQKPTGEQP